MERLTGLIFLPLAIIAAIWFSTPVTSHGDGLDSDGVYYAAMTLRDPRFEDLASTAPYCWRPLTPWMASFVAPADPSRLVPTLRALNVVSAWVSLATLHALLRRIGLSGFGSFIGVLLYAGVFWTVKFSFFSPAYVDHASMALLMLALLATAAQCWWLAALVVTIAAFQKESILAVVPMLIAWRWRFDGLRTIRGRLWCAVTVLAPLSVVTAIRIAITPSNDYSAWSMMRAVVATQIPDPQFWKLLLPELSVALGAMLFVLLAYARPCAILLRENPQWAVMLIVGLPLAFAGLEKARLLLPLVPACIFLSATLLDRAWQDGFAGRAWVVLTLLIHFYLGHHLESMSSIDEYFTRMTPLHGLREGDATPELMRIAVVGVLWLLATLLLQPLATTGIHATAEPDESRSPQ
jgi:hypothetical protein